MNFLRRTRDLFKKDIMLSVSLAAAGVSFLITPPSRQLLSDINWRTLASLFMLLSVLEGFKKENIFEPLLRMTKRLSSIKTLTIFLVFSVFLSSMFVTNDVSLIIFVPLTIILLRAGGKEKYILPVLTLENIAAIRGSLLTPFGSPQNLFLYARSGITAFDFIKMMAPLWILSALLLMLFIAALYRKAPRERIVIEELPESVFKDRRERALHERRRIMYIALLVLALANIVTRTRLYPLILALVTVTLLIGDRKILAQTDYVLLLTFLCFFIFSSSVCRHPAISSFLAGSVAGHEYAWSIVLSQAISNVPAAIVLYPFSTNLRALLYGLDSAGLCSLIGSLASVINLRLYAREYPGKSADFIRTFMRISLAFFAIVALPQLLLIRLLM